MLHVTGGESMKLHGLKKDHVHWTTVAGAAGAAASPPPEATAADASPPQRPLQSPPMSQHQPMEMETDFYWWAVFFPWR